MKRMVLALAGAMLAAGCAQTPETKPATVAASSGCKPPPRELEVKDIEPGKGEERARFRSAVMKHICARLI